MHDAIWHWFRSVWRDVNALSAARIADSERRQVELTCREHGMLWLIDQRYSGMVPAPVAIRSRPGTSR